MKQNLIFVVAAVFVMIASVLLDNNFMLLMVVPILTFVSGYLLTSEKTLQEKPEVNSKAYFLNFSYKTGGSMRSQETWEFANTYCGKLWKRWSIFMLFFSEIIMFFFQQYTWTLGVLFAVQIIMFLSAIYVTENAIDKTFDRQGNRREQ
mgnify:CR=1 FL=1